MTPTATPTGGAASASLPLSKTVAFNIGGTKVEYLRNSIKNSGSNRLSQELSSCSEGTLPFIDANPAVYLKWVDPFLRYNIIPDSYALKQAGEQEKRVLQVMVEALGLTPLAKLYETTKRCCIGR